MTKGVAATITYSAANSSTGVPVSNDQANHALKLVRDGVESTPTNAPAARSNGEYALALTAAEMNADAITVSGTSTTANVRILPVRLNLASAGFSVSDESYSTTT
jgi:tryptophanyl-tRNA synthetase